MNVEISYSDAALTKEKHDSMKAWHANMSEQHAIAAEWHNQQSDILSKAMINVPLDPQKTVRPLGGQSGATTSQPASSSPSATNVGDIETKKMDLTEILNSHVEEFGSFDKTIEEIVNILIGR